MRNQRGVAALTAILIVAVAASAATYMLAQQSAMLDRSALVAARAQADFYAQAGLDWARGVLAADPRGMDSLAEGWAQPIVGLPIERAVVAGRIDDEQGKLNLNNVVRANQRSERDVRILRNLLAGLALPVELADAVVDWIDRDEDLSGPGGAENAFYLSHARPYRAANQPMVQVEELHRIRGFDAATVAKLRPHVTALPPQPERLLVNVNTATPAVLSAVLEGWPAGEVARLLEQRRTQAYATRESLGQRHPKVPAGEWSSDVDVKSGFFSVRVQVAQDDVHLATEALVQRAANAAPVLVWRRSVY